MLGLGMIVPVLPKLIEDFLHGNSARAAEIFGLFATVWAAMQFLFSPPPRRAFRSLRTPARHLAL